MRDPTAVLTERQREVLRLVREGLSNREVGDRLGISEDGVKAHLGRLYLRYGVTNRVELLNVVNENVESEILLARRAPLGTLRAIARRADGRSAPSDGSAPPPQVTAKLAQARDALSAVDVALDLIRDLPPETTGQVLDVVRNRLAGALHALGNVDQELSSPRSA